MQKILRTLISSLLCLIILTSFLNGCRNKQENIIKIGAILPLTGDIAQYGQGCKKGIDIAIDELNKKDKSKKWEVEYLDDRGDSKESVNSAMFLDSRNIKIIIGPVTSSAALSLIPIINKKEILLFSPTASSPDLSCSSDLFLRIWPSDNYEAKALADYASKNLKINNTFIIYINNDYGIGLKNQFQKTFSENGCKIVGVESYSPNQNSFKEILLKAKSFNDLKSIYIIGYHKELALLTRQIRELKINSQIFASANFETNELLNMIGDLANNVIYATPSSMQKDTSITNLFERQFQSKYMQNSDIFAKNSYDIVKILSTSILDKNINNPKDIISYIKKNPSYEGVSGTVRFDKCGDVIKFISIKAVKNKEFIEIERLNKIL